MVKVEEKQLKRSKDSEQKMQGRQTSMANCHPEIHPEERRGEGEASPLKPGGADLGKKDLSKHAKAQNKHGKSL